MVSCSCWGAMAVFYLASYRDGSKRLTSQVRESEKTRVVQRRMHLHGDPWFTEILRESGYDEHAKDTSRWGFSWLRACQRARHGVSVHGLVKLTPKHAFGDLFSRLDREDRLLHEYLGRVADVVGLRVSAVERFTEAIDVFTDNQGADLKLRHDVCLLAADLSSQPFSSGRTLAAILRAWGVELPPPPPSAARRRKIPVLLVVEPIAVLVMLRKFRTVAIGAGRFMAGESCPRIMKLGEASVWSRLASLLQEAAAYETAEPLRLDLRSVADVASHLRQWATLIVCPAGEGDGGSDSSDAAVGLMEQRRMHLRWCLLQLDALRDSVDGNASQARELRAGGRGWQVDTGVLLHCLRLVTQVRNRHSLSSVVDTALQVTLPSLADDCRKLLSSRGGGSISAATLTRAQPCLDASFLLLHKKMLDSGSWLLYVWADSSPQLSYNFFLTTMLAIREDSLCGAATIANKLALTPYTADLSDEEAEPVLKARAGMVKGLGDMITIINNMPQCLALGGSALAHKVDACFMSSG